jgi:hypothetical protein
MYRISRNLPAELVLRLNSVKLDTLTPLSDSFHAPKRMSTLSWLRRSHHHE